MRPLVLAYHGVAMVPFGADRHRLFTAPAQVERDVSLLRRWGYRLVTYGTLAATISGRGADGARGLAALTFDDGFRDNLTCLLPVLLANAAPATVFVVSGWLGDPHPDHPESRVLAADEVRALHAAGVEIGAHTRHHRDLTTLDDQALHVELGQGRNDLEQLLDAPVAHLAYPYGAADDVVRAAARAAGFASACRTAGEGRWDDPFDLPRQAMGNGSSRLGLRLKASGRYQQVVAVPGGAGVRRLSRRAHNLRARAVGARRPTRRPPPPG